MTKIKQSLVKKLHPSRFTAMSGKMAAIVGCILDQSWTEPRIIAMTTTSDGFVLAQQYGDYGYNHFIGSVGEVEANWDTLLDAAGLTAGEFKLATKLFHQKTGMK